MIKLFEIVGYGEEEIQKRFGALYTAFQYGAPPHAGCAPGLDRIFMILEDEENIRDVVAFPKMQNASELMSSCPAPADPKALEELGISVKVKEEE